VPEHIAAALGGAATYDAYPWPPTVPWAFTRTAAWQGGYDAVVVMPGSSGAAEGELTETLAGMAAAAADGRCLVLVSPETPQKVTDAIAGLGLASAGSADEEVTGTILDMARRSGR
jgi:hypothetical protein